MSRRQIRVDPHERLADSPKQMTSMGLPPAVHHRLDELVELGTAMRTSRGEIVAMLVATADFSADELEQALLAYRKMRARDLSGSDEATVVRLHGPGRRRSG